MDSPDALPGGARVVAERGRSFLALVLAVPLVPLSLAHFGVTPAGLLTAFFLSVLVLLSLIDLEERRIPNRIVLPAFAVVLVGQVATSPDRTGEWVFAAVGAALFFLLPSLLFPGSIGMGDVKLALLLGAMLGKGVIAALLVASLGAAAAGLALLVVLGPVARKSTLPYAPFLSVGALVALFLTDALSL